MKRIVTTIAVVASLISWTGGTQRRNRSVVLPNYTLLACRSANCPQVWQDGPAIADGLFPTKLSIDIDNTSGLGVVGFTAVYDKSVSIDDLKSSIDQRYGQWALAQFDTSSIRMWRVEPEKFAIQLSTDDNGAKHLVYLRFAPNRQVLDDWIKSAALQNKK